MTDAARHGTTLRIACMVAASVLIGLLITLVAPFRVADCGPADPMLLRYLGGPFLHSTGTGIPASMESRIWAGPFALNVALMAAIVFALQWFGGGQRQALRPWILRMALALAIGMVVILLSIVINVDAVEWTLSAPPIVTETCDVRFEFRPDHRGWQPDGAS